MLDEQRTQAIREKMQAASKEVRAKYPVLVYQDALGFLIFSLSIAMILIGAWFYLRHEISAWVVVPWIAFWTSILHEIEHDLIHFLYFRKNKGIQNLMMLGVWVFRPLTLNPWFRRTLHFHHHRVSGTKTDFEERGVTNGDAWGFRRLISTGDLFIGGLFRSLQWKKDLEDSVRSGETTRAQAREFRKFAIFGMLPFTLPLYFLWYFYLVQHEILKADVSSGITFLVVLLILPNVIRMFCLHFITSNLHYYGDVEPGNVIQQTQILDAWYFVPFQVFCFNFGSTHAIHHFWVNETFYIRQMTAPLAHRIMRENGVRFNDLGTFLRANRYFPQ